MDKSTSQTHSATASAPHSATSQLIHQLDIVRKRLFSMGAIAACGWAFVAFVSVVLIAVWLDLIWELTPNVRRLTSWIACVAAAVVLGMRLIRLRRRVRHDHVANRLDSVAESGGQIAAGLQLVDGLQNASTIQQGLAEMAISDAAETALNVKRSDAVPVKPVKQMAIAVGALALLGLVISLAVPKLLPTEISRFLAPDSDVPTFTTLEFEVNPGDTSVHYGQPVDIEVLLNKTTVDEPVLVIDGSSPQTVPMFSAGERRWQATLFKVKEPLDYQIQVGRAKSNRFHIDLISVPKVNDVQFYLTPPQYTGLGERVVGWQDSISGLANTKIKVVASSNMPLTSGELTLTQSATDPEADRVSRTVELSPLEDDPARVVGNFELNANEKFVLTVTNADQIESTQTVTGSIALQRDDQPFIRLTSPKPSSLATADIELPVTISAEDDFGISQVSLYRSLNQSKSRPQRIEFEQQATRLNGTVMLPLNRYDLQPGDTLELFARVEDNRPGTVNSSESPVYSVKIISQEQFRRMNRERLGVEAVLSKYRMIQRRLERLEQQQRLVEAMEDRDAPQEQLRKNQQKQLNAVQQDFHRAAQEFRDLTLQRFPIDFDEELTERIIELSEKMMEIAQEIRKLEQQYSQGEVQNDELKTRLKELREKLQGLREKFRNEAMKPLAQLAQVFKLVALQQQFVQIVAQQQGLASRLKALDGNDRADRPDMKRQMREKADEQNLLKRSLDELLQEIEDNALTLPIDGELDQLRETSMKFVATVVDSDAQEEQKHAADALAEFSGSAGFNHAKRAAFILSSLLDRSEQVNQAGQQAGANIFQPGIGRPRLGKSLAQMMDLFGPKNGGRMGGQNQQGIYGNGPQQQQQSRGQGQGDKEQTGGSRSGFYIGSVDTPQDGNVVKRSGGNVGNSQINIPPRYRRQVGQYYRRIVDEIGDQ